MSTEFRIVSLCGSAGALPAYIEILKAMPVDSGMAFVVLTHRRMGTPCWLVDILSRVTRMKVGEIAEGCIFKPNQVYVIPAGEDLTIDGETFSLVPAATVNGWPDAASPAFCISLWIWESAVVIDLKPSSQLELPRTRATIISPCRAVLVLSTRT